MVKKLNFLFLCTLVSCASVNDNPIYLNLTNDFDHQFVYKSFSGLPTDENMKIGSVDLDGDFKREIMLFSPSLSLVNFYVREGEEVKRKFENISTKVKGYVHDYLSIDIDFDHKEELIVAYKDHVEICKFMDEDITCNEILSYESCQQVLLNGVDLELDQQLDFFLSCQRGSSTENYLFNYDQGSYKNIASEAKIPINFPTKYAYFVDLDKDSLQDLVLVGSDASFTMMRNLGNAEFKEEPFKYKPFFWGSVSFIDIDNDQDLDLVVSIAPGVEAKEKWLALINKGSFQFENSVDEYFLHGAMSAEQVMGVDLDLDGFNDIIATFDQYQFIEEKENSYILKQMDRKSKKVFSFEMLMSNPSLANGKSILFDWENNGRPSLVGINGQKNLWFLNSNVRTPYTAVKFVPSTKNLGTKIVLQTNWRKSYLYEMRLKDGAASAFSSSYAFGMSPLERPLFYTLYYAGRKEVKVENLPMNKPILLKE